MRLSAITAWVIGLACLPAAAASGGEPELAAFPGAEGFGAVSRGGRGGRVIKVTTLDPDGPGSLGEACAAEGPRIVVFDVGGVIKARGQGKGQKIVIRHPFITIAGQTAPSPGITIEGMLSTQGVKGIHDVVVRFLRVRPRTAGAGNIRTIEFNGPDQHNMILDHLSMSWGSDDTCSMSGPHHITVQWCAVEESDIHLEGGDEPHNFGMMFGTYGQGSGTLHHTLFAHHHDRTPLLGADPTDFRNCVLYNVGTGLLSHPDRMNHRQPGKRFDVNQVGNYVRWGRGSVMGSPRLYHPPTTVCRASVGPGKSISAFSDGNFFDWAGGHGELDPKHANAVAREHDAPPVETHEAEEAYELVLAAAGCLPRDPVSERTVREVFTRTGLWGRKEPDAGLCDGMPAGKAPADGDGDGLPDEWEKARGLDPADPQDAGGTVPAGASPGDRHKGYTWIEYYVNEQADLKVAEALTAWRLRAADPAPWDRPANRLSYEPKPLAELVKLVVDQNVDRKQTETAESWYAVQALSRMGAAAAPAVPELVKALETDDVRSACFAAWAIGAIGPAAGEAVPALTRALEKSWPVNNSKWNFNPAGFAAWALGRIGGEARPAVPALIRALSGKDVWARRPAAFALGQIRAADDDTVKALVRALEDDGGGLTNTHVHAVEALGALGARAVPALSAALGGKSAEVRRGAAAALGLAGTAAKPAVPKLLELLGAAEPDVRVAALKALAAADPSGPGVAAGLAGLLKAPEYGVRCEAAAALAACGSAAQGQAAALAAALSDGRREVRRSAALALGRIGPAGAAPLQAGLASADAGVRRYCARALGAAGGVESAAALDRALSDPAAEVRREAAWSLARLGPAAKSSAGALKTALGDADCVVRHAAAEALKRVGG